ncbi:MAG: glutamate synthase central domain-containing protein, partial [Myxococcota bacterium]|nr:glutamate synthase central domain-containing protein [Myxococcota bacterium]
MSHGSRAAAHDACGILGGLTRARAPLGRFVRMLDAMSHRGGDGLGVLFRISREVLASELAAAPVREPAAVLAAGTEPLVLTLQVPAAVDAARAAATTREELERHGLALLYALPVSRATRDEEAVRTWRFVARDTAPGAEPGVAARVLAARRGLEARGGSDGLPPSFHPVSFSAARMVLYKQIGSLDDWVESFGRQALEQLATDCFIAHVRYSTNTLPRHRSAQPFGLLAHNGEINNIGAIRRAMRDAAIPTSAALSDSSDLDALAAELCAGRGLALSEALQLLFPRRWPRPDADEAAAAWRARLARAARAVRAEGPAALVATDGRGLVGRVDNLGLRPLALVETRARDVFFASEPGAVAPLAEVARIHQLRPGEMILVRRDADGPRLVGDAELEALLRSRRAPQSAQARSARAGPPPRPPRDRAPLELRRTVAGFSARVRRQLEALFLSGAELGSGTGWRGGFAVSRGPGARLADAFQAMTAQVTAPTLSAEHESAAMDGRVVLGAAPSLDLAPRAGGISLALPLLLPDEDLDAPAADAVREATQRVGIPTLRALRGQAGSALVEIDARVALDAAGDDAAGAAELCATLERVCAESLAHAEAGETELLLLRCTWGADPRRAPLPPELAVGAVDQALTERGLRRRVSLLVASEAISDPHSMFVLLQLGADALVPTLLGEEAIALAARARRAPAETLERGLRAAVRALFIMYGRIATSEIAAGRGGRRVCAVGLDPELVRMLGLPSALGSGCGPRELWQGLRLRGEALAGSSDALAALQEPAVDTMPLDAALGGYALLGGFDDAPGRRPRSAGQLRVAAQVLADAVARQTQRGEGDAPHRPSPPASEADARRLLQRVGGLPVERAADLHLEL